MDLWSKFPSVRPVKGIITFFYIWSRWDELNAELKKRDERLQAVEETTAQMMRLQGEAHEAEKQKLERELRDQKKLERQLAEEVTKSTATIQALVERSIVAFQKLYDDHKRMRSDFIDTLHMLTFMLAIEESMALYNRTLANLPQGLREIVSNAVQRLRASLGATETPRSIPPSER